MSAGKTWILHLAFQGQLGMVGDADAALLRGRLGAAGGASA